MKHLREALCLLTAKMIAYHGSREPDLDHLRAHDPGYSGGLGYGVYVSENYETAKFYGDYVYKVELNLNPSDIFYLSAENQDVLEDYAGSSIIPGESIPAFYFTLKGQRYLVSSSDMDEDFGVLANAKEVFLDYVEENLPEDAAGYITEWTDKADQIPSDFEDMLMDFINADSDEDFNIRAAPIIKVLQDAEAAADAYYEQNKALVITLDEIGAEVSSAGYKALYFERASSVGDELLVFDEADVTVLGLV